MAKSKLLTALDAQKGRNYNIEKQKKLQKQAVKKKKSKAPEPYNDEKENEQVHVNGKLDIVDAESNGWESDESEAANATAVRRF